MTFRLSVLPAGDGDCLLLTYGDGGRNRHVLIDGGRAGAYSHLRKRLVAIRDAGEELGLFVLTHIDADHIEGALEMGRDLELPIEPTRLWYNGYDQMAGIQPFSVAQGDEYSRLIKERQWPLNADFGGGAVCVEARPDPFDVDGLAITILSPNAAKLASLRSKWDAWRSSEAVRKAAREARKDGLQAMGRAKMPAALDVEKLVGPTLSDVEPPNGSSIAFIAEWQGKRVLFAGDAHPDMLEDSIAPLADKAGGRLPINLLKVSHHGSRGNTTRKLVELLDCRSFLISTDGRRHGHPDPEAIARLLAYSGAGEKTLYFNYRTERTEPWDAASLKAQHEYQTKFGDPDGFLEIDI